MNAHIVRGQITAAAEHIAVLPDPACGEVYSGSDRVPWATRAAHQLQFHPMVLIWIHIAQQYRSAVEIVNHHIDLTIVEQIAKCSSAPHVHVGRSEEHTSELQSLRHLVC